MIAAVDVKATIIRKEGNNTHFEAWTTDEHKYNVVHGPTDAPGICKHCIRCASLLVGDWLHIGCLQMKSREEMGSQTLMELKKVNRDLERRKQWTK
jgi:hypothetical protein